MIPKRLRLTFTGAAALGLAIGLASALPAALPIAWAQNAPPAGSPASGVPAPAYATTGGDNAPGSAAAYANMAARMDNLQSEIDSLTGQIQVINHQLQQLSDRMGQLTKNAASGPNAPEGQGTPAGANAPAGNPAASQASNQPSNAAPVGRGSGGNNGSPLREPPPHPLGTIPANTPLPQPERNTAGGNANAGAKAEVALPAGSVAAQYKYATDFLRRGEYVKAGQALQLFLKAHPRVALASNAQYWLGQTYYVRQLYAQSAATFLAGYRSDPKGNKAPDDLLNLGMSLIALKKPAEACAVFKQLATQYPDAEPRIKQYAARERERAHCS